MRCGFFWILIWLGGAAHAADDAIQRALVQEVERAAAELADQPMPPYFVAAEALEISSVRLVAEDGALHGYTPSLRRSVDIDIRVGSPELDSTHALRSESERSRNHGAALPLTDDIALLRRAVWREIDDRYRDALERWAKVSSDKTVLVEEDPVPDLAPTDPVQVVEPLAEVSVDTELWESRLRRVSEVLAADHVVRDGSVSLRAVAENRWFVSSGGTRVRHGWIDYSVVAAVDAVADDGAELRLQRRWSARSPDGLPEEDVLLAGVSELHQQLSALREAPEQEPYTGPVILADRAAGVFFHEVFGHRVEGHRLKRIDNAQTFKDMVGQQVLPTFLSVADDPTMQTYKGIELRGFYRFDNEGVPAQRAVLVDDGVLEGFLQSRSPARAEDVSNGHGRRQPGKAAVTRQGNLVITASKTVSRNALRRELIAEARRRGLDYALRIDDIQGGFTFTGRGIPNAFNVNVLVAHRVYVDGRPDELVRGIDLIGTPLVAFSRIARAADGSDVFNGQCGAESGWVPVAAVAPHLLVTEIETQRKRRGQQTPALLPPPRPADPTEGT